MATQLREALKNMGKHNVAEINSIWAKPIANGAILEGGDLDNGALVELSGRDTEGNLKCKTYTGTGDFYILHSVVEDQLLVDMGETDYKCFFNKEGEIVRLFFKEKGLNMETSNYEVKEGATLALDAPILWDTTKKKYIVVKSDDTDVAKAVATVNGIDTDFGYNADIATIRIQFK